MSQISQLSTTQFSLGMTSALQFLNNETVQQPSRITSKKRRASSRDVTAAEFQVSEEISDFSLSSLANMTTATV